jgi:hypothetical protein
MDDLRQLSDTQRHQRISELRARLSDCYALQVATDLMYLELLPPNKPGPIGTPRCPMCGSPNVHEHSPDEIVIYRNGIRFGRATLSGSGGT